MVVRMSTYEFGDHHSAHSNCGVYCPSFLMGQQGLWGPCQACSGGVGKPPGSSPRWVLPRPRPATVTSDCPQGRLWPQLPSGCLCPHVLSLP